MRQGDGSDFLGPGNPRGSDIGIIYVDPPDSRQDILKAISTQELHGRKQIVIVLPEQRKAFRQPVDFDGLKNMRRGLQAQLVFIAPPGPGPAEFARQRRFPVYSSLDSFKDAILTQGMEQAGSKRGKSNPGDSRKPGLLPFGSRNKGRSGATTQPRGGPQVTPDSSPVPQRAAQSYSVADVDTVEFPRSNDRQIGPAALAAGATGLAAGAFIAGSQGGEDDELYPAPGEQPGRQPPPTPFIPQTPAQVPPTPIIPQTPEVAESAVQGNQPVKPPVESRSASGGIIVFPSTSGTGNRPEVIQGSSSSTGRRMTPPQGRRASATNKLPPTPEPTAETTNGNSGKIAAAAVAGGAIALGAADLLANSGANASAASAGTGAQMAGTNVGANAAASMNASGQAGAPPATAAANARSGGPRATQAPSTLTPLPPPRPPRRSPRRRTILLLLLLLLLSGILFAAIALNKQGGIVPLIASDTKATVTITPASKLEQNLYLLTGITKGAPDATQRQIQATILTQTSDTRSATGHASGSILAKQATGSLIFVNGTTSGITVSGTTLTGKDGVQVAFSGSVFVPAIGQAGPVSAYAIAGGTRGNIGANDIFTTVSSVAIKNPSAFSGGQNAIPNTIIEQRDIDGAARPLISSLTSSTKTSLEGQVQSNQRVVDNSFQCTPKTTANERPGAIVKTVTVKVSVTCSEEVYDYQGALQIGKNLLMQEAQNDSTLSPQYMLDGQIVANVTSVTKVSSSGRLTVNVQAQGLWVYTFTSQMQANIKQELLKLSQQQAQNVLLHQMGVADAKISIAGGDTMPTSVDDITLVIQPLPGVGGPGPGTPGPGTPTVASTPTATPTLIPSSPTPVNGLGGS